VAVAIQNWIAASAFGLLAMTKKVKRRDSPGAAPFAF
jgi:hypothetical protein